MGALVLPASLVLLVFLLALLPLLVLEACLLLSELVVLWVVLQLLPLDAEGDQLSRTRSSVRSLCLMLLQPSTTRTVASDTCVSWPPAPWMSSLRMTSPPFSSSSLLLGLLTVEKLFLMRLSG